MQESFLLSLYLSHFLEDLLLLFDLLHSFLGIEVIIWEIIEIEFRVLKVVLTSLYHLSNFLFHSSFNLILSKIFVVLYLICLLFLFHFLTNMVDLFLLCLMLKVSFNSPKIRAFDANVTRLTTHKALDFNRSPIIVEIHFSCNEVIFFHHFRVILGNF